MPNPTLQIPPRGALPGTAAGIVPSSEPSALPPAGDSLAARLQGVARHQGFSPGAVRAMWDALVLGHGGMAQFSHDEFGGSGQWMRGGMVMLGDMFNRGLASRVSALCDELSQLYAAHPGLFASGPAQRSPEAAGWWPAALGTPATSGAQNDLRYAWFPATRRLAIERGGVLSLHDTLDHRIDGVSQQQGVGSSLRFASQHGPVDLDSLPRLAVEEAPGGRADDAPAAKAAFDAPAQPGIHAESSASHTRPPRAQSLSSDGTNAAAASGMSPISAAAAAAAASATAARASHRPSNTDAAGDPLTTIDRLAELHDRGVLTDAEFQTKKTELLARL